MEINIAELIEKRVEEMDLGGMTREIIRDLVSSDVKKAIESIVREECRKMITEEISRVLSGPVYTDDGWGKKECFPSLEDLFKAKLKKELEGSWDAKREIEKQVSSRVNAIMQNQYKEVVTKIVDGLTGSYLKKTDS